MLLRLHFLLMGMVTGLRRQSGQVKRKSSEDSCDWAQCAKLASFITEQVGGTEWECGEVDVSIGLSLGRCCSARSNYARIPRILASASKMIAGYTVLKLVDEGVFNLDTRVGDVLDWWDVNGKREKITVRNLMAMTSGIVPPEDEVESSDRACKSPEDKTACSMMTRSGFEDNEPGEVWRYSQVDLAVIGEIAEKLTGLDSWQAIFDKYIGARLGVDPGQCYWMESLDNLVVAGGMRCHIDEYSKLLQAMSAKSLVRNSLWDEAERPYTLGLPMIGGVGANNCTAESSAAGCKNGEMPQWRNWKEGVYWHYGLMQWIECATPECEAGAVRISSPGLLGTYPWVDRGQLSGARPHWGVVYRQQTGFCGQLYKLMKVSNTIVRAR
jgi:hypothetical protein